MDVPDGQGILAIRDADETQALGSPTKITGTVDEETGVVAGVSMSTPPLEFETVALGFPVDVRATFTQVGSGTGLVAATPPPAAEGQAQTGSVAVRVAVNVVLDLKVRDPGSGAVILEPHCETPTPVSLEFLSEGAYTEPAGGKIVDPDFTIPEVPTTPACIAQVADGVNDLLGGPGHSLSLVIKGDLPVPELKPETTTTLTADPAGGSIRGNPVTLTAAVAPVEPNDLDPTGTVVFKEGARTLGTADIQPDGTATLTTTDLRSGDRSLTAAYQGDPEFAPSASNPVAYNVAPAPIITGTFPEYITRGADPVEFDLTIDNTGSLRPMANARVDIVVPGLNGGNLVMQRQLHDSSWATVLLGHSWSVGGLAGTLGPDSGASVPANAVQTFRLRISAPDGAPIHATHIDFELVTVDGSEDPATVASASWPFNIVLAARTATQTSVIVYDTAIRPGQTLYVQADVWAGGNPANTGEVEFLLDGKVTPFRVPDDFGPLAPKQTRVPINGGFAFGEIDVPADLTTGPHLVSVRYLGDTSYLPSTPQGLPSNEPFGDGPFIIQVIDPLGPLYTCDWVTVSAAQLGAYVQAFVRLPAYAQDGAELDLDDVEITVIPGGLTVTSTVPQLATFPGFGVDGIEVDLGDAGILEGDSLVYEPDDPDWMLPADLDADQILRLQNVTGTIVVDGEPGEVMALPIERISMTGLDTIGGRFTFTCVPQAEPVVLEEVGVAGVSLTVETSTSPVRVGDEVVLTATAAPALPTGLVEFFSGSTSLGTASGAEGTASITVEDLPVGSNALTARYYGVPWSPFTSEVVELEVRPAVECPEFAEEGTSATVRLVYLELLGRCPDQAGFDYWKGRLDGGTSPEVFARAISSSPEAVGMVVDDAYVTMLGRKADADGKAFWVERMISRNGRYDQLLADLGSSSEFWSQAGSSNAGFVGRVYEQLLNRTADQAGQDFWVGRLNAGTSPRALILSLANLDEPLGVLATDSYLEILGRGSSVDERTTGIAFLRRTGDRSGLYAQLIGTSEFTTRAQSFPNPED